MPLQRSLLRLILILLAAAAAAAIAAVFTGSTTILWRVVLTCAEAAVACAVIMRLSRFLERPAQRPAAVAGFASLLLSFGLALFCTWIDLLGFGDVGRLLGAAFAIAGFGWLGTAGLAMRERADRRLAGDVLAIVSGATLGVVLAAIWTEWSLLGRLAAAAGPPLIVGPLCLIGEAGWRRPWRFVGVALAVAAAAIGVQQAARARPDDAPWQWYTALCAALAAVTLSNLLMLARLSGGWWWLRAATIVSAFGAAAGITVSALSERTLSWAVFDQTIGRFTAAAGILAACGTLATVARQRLSRRFVVDAAGSSFDSVRLACPRCGRAQLAPVGESPCVGCRLLLSVRVSEPRCASCGYSLLDLRDDRCPECGHAIPARGVAIAGDETSPSSAVAPG
jgi:hypothetical protein